MDEVNGKSSGGVRDLIKVKDEDMDSESGREKGKSLIVKSVLFKIERKPNNASKVMLKSTKSILSSINVGASSSLGKKKVMQTKTMTMTTTKTVMEQKKEKKVYYLPGQKNDPPQERDPLRVFYSTLRDQMPESKMAKFWLMAYGLLPQDEAKKALKHKQRWGQSLKYGTPSRSSTPSRLSNRSLAISKSTLVSNNKDNDVGTSSKGKNKRANSKSDSEDIVLKTQIKKKLKA